MNNILGTLYGGNWVESKRESAVDQLELELNNANASVSTALVTISTMQKTNAQGVLEDILDRKTGQPVLSKSIVLSLVSKTEKNADGTPKYLGNSFLRLSKKSTLNPGDSVDYKTLEKITLSKLGEPDREYYDATKL